MTDQATKTKTRKPNVGSDPTKGGRVWLWQVGLYAFAFGSSALLIGITLLRLLQGRFSPAAAIAALVVCGMSWTLITNSDKAVINPGGIDVGTSEPALTAFVHELADEVGAPRPDAIVVVAEALLLVAEEVRFFGLRHGRRVLIVGLPYLHSMTRAELAAGAAHHLGHYAPSEIEHGVEGMRALRAAGGLIAVERESAIYAVYGSYARKVFRSVGGVGVAQEQCAERKAVDAYGTSAMVSCLTKLDDVAVAWDQLLRDYVVPALQNDAHPANLVDGFEQLLKSGPRAAERTEAVSTRRNQDNPEFDPHDTPGRRLEIVSEWPEAPATAALQNPNAPASGLLDPDAKTADIVVGKWAQALMKKRTEPQSWQQLNDEVFSVASYTLASKGFEDDELTGTEQLEHILDWSSADWATVDEKLARVTSLSGDNLERRSAWTQAVVVEAAAASGKFSWSENWDGPPQLVDASGVSFDPEPVADALTSDPAKARAVFEDALQSAG